MRKVPITDLAEINPPLTVRVQNDAQVAFIPMSAVREGGGIKLLEQVRYCEVSTGFTKFQDGDVLFAKITPCMENGKGALVENLPNKVGCGSTEFHVLRARENCASRYLFQLTQWSVVRQKAETFMSGSAGQQRVLSDFFTRHKVYAPPLEAQRKVAQILKTIDQAIEHTSTLIEKYQQIKAGLMHDLFTRGIGADGKLRPPREQARDLYQETPIGWIPKEWVVTSLRSCLLDNPTNGIYKPPHEIGDGTLMIGQTAFTKERSIEFDLCRRGAISTPEQHRYGVAERNILITRVFATVDGVGQPALVPKMTESAVFESNMMRLRVDEEKINAVLLFEWIRMPWIRKLIVAGANASNQVSVNQGLLCSLPVPKIGNEEQYRITVNISAYSKNYDAVKLTLEKLLKQKSGLMQDLLTGKVQVTLSGATMDNSNV